MPEVGETGWGQLVSNNFAIIDGMDKIDSITTTFTVLTSTTVNIDLSYITYNSTTNYPYAYIYNSTSALIPSDITITPSQSCRYFLIYINGDLTINGNINTYPTTLKSELPPNSPETNTLDVYRIGDLCNSLTTLVSKTGTNVTMDIQEPYLGAYLDFYSRKTGITTDVIITIPHAIAAGGVVGQDDATGSNGTAGTASNTCNGGGGSGTYSIYDSNGGTGCIFGQYEGGDRVGGRSGYGYGRGASSKYRCALIFVVNGNLTINENVTITQIGGNAVGDNGGYGGGAYTGGGGGSPVFIYYTGSYVNNGTINTAGGSGYNSGGAGGAGGIKVTQITL